MGTNQSPEQSDLNSDSKKYNPFWGKIAAVLNFGPNKMEAFRKLIDQA